MMLPLPSIHVPLMLRSETLYSPLEREADLVLAAPEVKLYILL
jgi:hypothetical protein